MVTRSEVLASIEADTHDICVIGGGASGAGCALDSQLRGLKTVLVDAGDFASSTSSASTKMVHGGVRYLQAALQGLDIQQYRLVEHALRERLVMLRNAPHLCRPLEFLVPCRSRFDQLFYGIGMKVYDWISGQGTLSPSRFVSLNKALRRLPSLTGEGLAGAISYSDGQFDDSRYVLALLNSFCGSGGTALNYARIIRFEKDERGKLTAAITEDQLSKRRFRVSARAFVNATGPWSDAIRTLALPGMKSRMRPSKGVHVLFPLNDFPDNIALMVPKTEDGRVIFAIPWMGRLLVGTTDDEVGPDAELLVTHQEIAYLLRQLNPYLSVPLTADQVVSGFAGLRPLVGVVGVDDTKRLVRDDEVEFDAASGLISILGGKWTTYRSMAEKTLDRVQNYLGRGQRACSTQSFPLDGSVGYTPDYCLLLAARHNISPSTAQHLAGKFGTNADGILAFVDEDPGLGLPLVEGFPAIRAEVVHAVRREMAMMIDDVLDRRIGLQLYSWRLSIDAAPVTGMILARELGWTVAQTDTAVHDYVAKVNRMRAVAGLTRSEPVLFETAEERR
jgi:glycerol-3-phosphate dehydrogenase